MSAIEIEASVVDLELGERHPRCRLLTGPELRERARALSGSRRSSRSYRAPYALVADWHAQVGVDIERIEPVDDGFGLSIATPLEREMFSGRLRERRLVAELWSGKEALSKALGDSLRYDPRRLDAPLGWAESLDGRPSSSGHEDYECDDVPVDVGTELEAGVWRAERLPVPDGYVGWLCWRV